MSSRIGFNAIVSKYSDMKNGTLTNDLTKCHKQAILRHLQAGLEIELDSALRLYHCSSLRSRIADLRRDGWPIGKRWKKFVAPSGFHGQFAVYSLPKVAKIRYCLRTAHEKGAFEHPQIEVERLGMTVISFEGNEVHDCVIMGVNNVPNDLPPYISCIG